MRVPVVVLLVSQTAVEGPDRAAAMCLELLTQSASSTRQMVCVVMVQGTKPIQQQTPTVRQSVAAG